MKYAILKRYQYWGKEGRKMTNWHELDGPWDTKEAAEAALKKFKPKYTNVSKITKLPYEFMISEIIED